jgi:hypothetical protein
MPSPKWAAMTSPQGSMISPGNDSRHNLADPNQGGSPLGGSAQKRIPQAQRGGVGHQGRDRVHVRAGVGGGRGSTGNPASRGAGSFQPEARIPGHGGSPQHRGGAGSGAQFGKPGQAGVPGGNPTQPPAGPGNTSGRSYRLIAGRFKRAAMGAKAGQNDMGGKYGSAPVTANT